ncbi:NUDIX domain-containing protein [Bacillus carboniphilus]|uniref:NUDIX domain-containing protein n=1 Tax=Bacillus carboniphilus TaxID=86663 RepID=A0ABY9JS76_9BACI|nr:NUDIX domain-containing protein [Bacillus carboniphilus]WLR42264.1 NUDIX domain-containing protein [Bacillus carboniphilus]
MDLGESFEEVAKREIFEETGLVVENLTLIHVFSGSKYYFLNTHFKIANGDEIYSVTAVFYTTDVNGKIKVDYKESEKVQYFAMDDMPNELTDEYRCRILHKSGI